MAKEIESAAAKSAGLPDLPVAEILPELVSTLAARSNAVLVAPPGAGKTTLVQD